MILPQNHQGRTLPTQPSQSLRGEWSEWHAGPTKSICTIGAISNNFCSAKTPRRVAPQTISAQWVRGIWTQKIDMHGQYGVGMVDACSDLHKRTRLLSQPRGAQTSELQWDHGKRIAWLLHGRSGGSGNDETIHAEVSTGEAMSVHKWTDASLPWVDR